MALSQNPKQQSTENTIQLKIPTHLGYEKIVMATANAVARKMGLPEKRIDDLNTALAEAIINAMEHGNKMNPQLQVVITFTQTVGKLIISIRDQGQGFSPFENKDKPKIEDKLAGVSSPRGWGWFLIENLVDEVQVNSAPEGGTVIRLVILAEDSQGKEDVYESLYL